MIKITCELAISGSGMDFDEVSHCVGCEASHTLQARPEIRAAIGAAEFTWVLAKKYAGEEDPPSDGDHSWSYPAVMVPMSRLLARVHARRKEIRCFVRERGFLIGAVVAVMSDTRRLPCLELTSRAMGCLASLGAELQFVFYLDLLGPTETSQLKDCP
jgi:hypothetical protein